MLPGAHKWDAKSASKHLAIKPADMFCVDYSAGVLASFSREFPKTNTITGEVFEVLDWLGEVSPAGSFGAIDLDLCGCATPKVVAGLKRLRHNPMLANRAVIGITICRRWYTDNVQRSAIYKAFKPAEPLGGQCYVNKLAGGSNMLTMLFVME